MSRRVGIPFGIVSTIDDVRNPAPTPPRISGSRMQQASVTHTLTRQAGRL